MKKLILVSILATTASLATASTNYVYVGASGEGMEHHRVFLDTYSVERNGPDEITVMIFNKYDYPQTNSDHGPYIKKMSKVRVNCTKNEMGTVKIGYINSDDDMFYITPEVAGHPRVYKPGSIGLAMIDAACGRQDF